MFLVGGREILREYLIEIRLVGDLSLSALRNFVSMIVSIYFHA